MKAVTALVLIFLLRLKESKYFWAKCLDVVISERMFLCIIQTLGAFLFGIQLYTP